MYKYTRQEAAEMLNISTRSIDRYIKAWKLRAKKEWKVVYVKASDLENISSGINTATHQEVIINEPKKVIVEEKTIAKPSDVRISEFEEVYRDLRSEIKKKDEIIWELSIRVWRAEEIAKNSVTLVEFKKSQFLLEESKNHLNQSIEEIQKEKEQLSKDLKYQKTNNFIMIIVVVILFAIAGTIFFMNI